jgi:hypothetical protein
MRLHQPLVKIPVGYFQYALIIRGYDNNLKKFTDYRYPDCPFHQWDTAELHEVLVRYAL